MTARFADLAPGERVRRIVDAAARLANDATGRARARMVEAGTTGLSREGVAFAFEHIETLLCASDEASLLASVMPAQRVHVILSSNVFTAAVRALALAAAAAPRVIVKPSRREPVFAALLVEEVGVSEISLGEEAYVTGDSVHAYGRAETGAALQRVLNHDVPLWFHGPGFGVAISEGDEGDADALARDVVVFDQQGCLSPRVAFFVGEEAAGRRFAEALSQRLAAWNARIPIGAVAVAEREAAMTYRATMAAVGEVYGGSGALVGFDPMPRAVFWPSTPRAMHVLLVRDGGDAARLLAPLAQGVTLLAGRGAASDRLADVVPDARRARLGYAQRPRLDGPVDRRVPSRFAVKPPES